MRYERFYGVGFRPITPRTPRIAVRAVSRAMWGHGGENHDRVSGCGTVEGHVRRIVGHDRGSLSAWTTGDGFRGPAPSPQRRRGGMVGGAKRAKRVPNSPQADYLSRRELPGVRGHLPENETPLLTWHGALATVPIR